MRLLDNKNLLYISVIVIAALLVLILLGNNNYKSRLKLLKSKNDKIESLYLDQISANNKIIEENANKQKEYQIEKERILQSVYKLIIVKDAKIKKKFKDLYSDDSISWEFLDSLATDLLSEQ